METLLFTWKIILIIKKSYKKSINLSIKNKQMALCCDLSFGILSLSSYVDIKTINIVSFDVQKNENKLLRSKSK